MWCMPFQAAAASGAPQAHAAEMDMASILATFPPEVRDEVLQGADEQVRNAYELAAI